MADLIAQPRIIMAAGNKPKQIAEYVGRLNSGDEALSIARMVSPSGWSEPGQTPDFDEYTLVLSGLLRVRTRAAVIDVNAGQAKSGIPHRSGYANSVSEKIQEFQLVETLIRDLSHPAKKRFNGQALHEDRKSDDSKADGNDFFALRDFSGKAKGKSQRHCTSQAAPKQGVLMFHRDAKRGA